VYLINRFEVGGICIYAWDNKVEGNFIGTDPTGSLDRGNLWEGVYVYGDPTNTVGGTSLAGVNISAVGGASDAVGNSVLRNSIFSNAGMGIALDTDA
jgi:hypothetical protein